MIAFVFPGQGSQARGMGQSLFDEVAEYVAVEKDVDALLGYSMRRMCLQDEGNRLKETQYTQSAMYVVNALHYYRAIRDGVRPSYVAGHSLGEYNALLAAGCFDFLTGLRMVRKRGELMASVRNGGMAAVVGLSAARISQVIKENSLSSLDVANFNAPLQTVVSGPTQDIGRAGPLFEKAGASLYMPLPVSAAFHSRYLSETSKAFAEFLEPMSFAAPRLPIIANVTSRPYPSADASRAVKNLLVEQIVSPVQWTQSVRYLLEQGVKEFKELGHGNVLTRLIQQIQQRKDD